MSEVFFNGPAGRLEGRYYQSSNPKAPIALVLHPHPEHGGTMNNKVVYNLYKTLATNEFSVLRINFRGVGKSEGEYDNGVGELTDAATALDWLQVKNPLSTVHMIAGFSFGSWIALQLIMRRPEITNFLTISPPVDNYDFSFLSPCPIPGFILQGDMDSVVLEESVHNFASRLAKQKNIKVDYKMIQGADHFFRDKIDLMNEAIDNHLRGTFRHQQKPSNITKKVAEKGKAKKIFLD